MELDIKLKITKTRDDGNHSSSHLRISKDSAGPIFFSTETESMFILTAHLKGFRRKRIKIDINEDGTQIAISGEKAIQEMVTERWTMYKKEVEIKRFKRVFRIPDGVVLDKIKARFDEDTILSIFMPKLKKGIRGIGIDEVKGEEVDDDGEKSEIKPDLADEVPERETNNEEGVVHVQELEELGEIKKDEIEQLSEKPSSRTPNIISEMEPEENTPRQAKEIPEMVIQEPETESVEPLEIISESNVIEPPIAPDSPLSLEIQNETPFEAVAEQIENQEIPETETASPEAEPEEEVEEKFLQETVEPTEVDAEQVLDQLTEQIQNEEASEEEKTKEPEEAPEEHEDVEKDTSIPPPEIIEPIKLEPDPGVHVSNIPDQPPSPEQQIEEQEPQREEIHHEKEIEEQVPQREEIHPTQQIEEQEPQRDVIHPDQKIEEQEVQREETHPEQQIEEQEPQREEAHPEQQIEEQKQESQREEIYEFVNEALEENEEITNEASVPSSSSSSVSDEDEEPIVVRYPINRWNLWGRSPFQPPRFMVRSAFLGFLIAFVIHLLKKNKKAKKIWVQLE